MFLLQLSASVDLYSMLSSLLAAVAHPERPNVFAVSQPRRDWQVVHSEMELQGGISLMSTQVLPGLVENRLQCRLRMDRSS